MFPCVHDSSYEIIVDLHILDHGNSMAVMGKRSTRQIREYTGFTVQPPSMEIWSRAHLSSHKRDEAERRF